VKDISTFRAGIVAKMHMKSNAELIRYRHDGNSFDGLGLAP